MTSYYYSEEPAPEPIFALEGTSVTFVQQEQSPGIGSPALSNDDNLSTGGESGFGENDFFPYDYCSSVEGPNAYDLYDQFDLGIGTLINDIADIATESESAFQQMYPICEVKTEVDEQGADVEHEGVVSEPIGQNFGTFADLKIEEIGFDYDPSITVPITCATIPSPTPQRAILKASRNESQKKNKLSPVMDAQNDGTRLIETKSSGESAMVHETTKSSKSPNKRLYEMEREDCATEKKWQQVKRAKNTFNFHEKQRKKILGAEKIVRFFMKLPSAKRASLGNPEIKELIQTLFPDALKN